jgi:hypothetical protein
MQPRELVKRNNNKKVQIEITSIQKQTREQNLRRLKAITAEITKLQLIVLQLHKKLGSKNAQTE